MVIVVFSVFKFNVLLRKFISIKEFKNKRSRNHTEKMLKFAGPGIIKVKKIKNYIDHILLLFNFEKPYFDKENMPEYDWTELADLCPITKQWLQNLGFKKYQRVRFMLLDPGGYINPHRDVDSTPDDDFQLEAALNHGDDFLLDCKYKR